MKNRAKCRLCKAVIESFHSTDYVECSCKEISVWAGDAMHCGARSFENFIRIDDEGKEYPVTVAKKDEEIASPTITKGDLIGMFHDMVKNLENLPQDVMTNPINHYDFYSYMLLISEILRRSDKI